MENLPKNSEWDVIWSHEYPFFKHDLRPYIETIEPHQLVNHVPGSGFYTSKVSLATAGLKMGVPLAFEIPKEKEKFLKFTQKHPEFLWVQKSNAHRGIKILKIDQLDLETPETFVQKYVENPFLIDGRKFDIGIYTVITSVDPLRVYIYDSDALLRFCPENYEPFDPENVDKYVVADDYTPVWEMPSLKRYYNDLNLNFKETFNAYLKSIRKDPTEIWSQIEEIIRQVFESQNLNMKTSTQGYKNKRSFFELTRFDFMVDQDLKVFLMEANMSPNLSSSHFRQNQLLYEQVLMNVLSLVGVASHFHGVERQNLRNPDLIQSQVSDKDLHTYNHECYERKCERCTEKLICKLCSHCMDDDFREDLRQAYLENLSKRNMKRILPFSGSNSRKSQYETMTEKSKLQEIWTQLKCGNEKILCY
uniref:Uncharacterized protein n=1 Tax=Acrobeloides nanus TaxID=290746 RepID=A0A914EPV4_9BILA